MFALEVYNQLIREDLTKGYRIAGTGTINIDGEVAPIGGISQKVIAAHKAGADIFSRRTNAERNIPIIKKRSKQRKILAQT